MPMPTLPSTSIVRALDQLAKLPAVPLVAVAM